MGEKTLTGQLSAGGSGVGGQWKILSIDVKEYERHVLSMVEAKRAIPTMPPDKEFLVQSQHLWSQLSEEARRGVQFLLPLDGGAKWPLEKQATKAPVVNEAASPMAPLPAQRDAVYPPGKNADWVLPYLTALMKEYIDFVEGGRVTWRDRIPFFRYYPIGARIILSQYKGLLIHFTKKSNKIEFGTLDVPIEGNISVNNQIVNLPEDGLIRVRTEESLDTVWVIAYGSEEAIHFSVQKGKEHGRLFAQEDLTYYKPSKNKR